MAEPGAEDAEATKPEPKARRVKKEAVPEAEPSARAELPTLEAVKKAHKADLVKWLEELGLPTEGRVADLRARLSDVIEERRGEAAEPRKPAAARKAAKPEPEAEAPEAAGAKEEEEEAEEAEEYRAKAKPVLDDALRRALALRRSLAQRRPRFLRQEWYRYARLGMKWRRPQGGQSKLRRHMGYRINVVSIGYRSPRLSRGLHPSGFAEVLVHNVRELEGVDAKAQAVRVAHGVGYRKRVLIQEAADKRGIRVLNAVEVEE